ncbi:MAG TPA: hypothetical protein VMF67_18360 [Rhizomicrobium sp.]|nr:hypothetical protein [Rhizomicrobium sp.]
MIEALLAENRRERFDQVVILAVAIVLERRERAVGQRDGVGLRGPGKRPEIAARRAEYIADRAIAVVATRVNGFGKLHEPPHQLERVVRVDLRHPFDDRATLGLEIGGEVSNPAPIDEGARAGDLGETLAQLRRHALRRLLRGKLQPQPARGRRVVFGELQEQLGQALRTQSLEILAGQFLLRRHDAKRGKADAWY